MIHWFAARRRSALRPARRSARPMVEALESRLAPYAATGNAWPHPELVTLSFVPDGTVLAQNNGNYVTSNLFSAFNAMFNNNTAGWQNVILKAAQSWAAQTNINFALVGDDGSDAGSGAYEQGASNFGDIRIGGYDFGSCNWVGATSYPPQVNNYSVAGDVAFNTSDTFNIGSTYDLYTVAAHEIGHALGLAESSVSNSVMYANYTNSHTGLASDDIAGVRSIYSNGAARATDAYNTGTGNHTFATAANISSALNASTLTAAINNLDVTSVVGSTNTVTLADVEYFKFTAPANSAAKMTVQVQSSGLSLLSPMVTVYAANQTTVLGSATGLGRYGTTLTVGNIPVTPGATYYVKVQGADTSVFSVGKYALGLNLGTGATPTVAPPNTQTANGNPLSAGGGVPMLPWQQPTGLVGGLLSPIGAVLDLATGLVGGLLGGGSTTQSSTPTTTTSTSSTPSSTIANTAGTPTTTPGTSSTSSGGTPTTGSATTSAATSTTSTTSGSSSGGLLGGVLGLL
jgi:hypothetical protein